MNVCRPYIVGCNAVKSRQGIESAAPRGRFPTFKLTMILTFVSSGETFWWYTNVLFLFKKYSEMINWQNSTVKNANGSDIIYSLPFVFRYASVLD